MLSLRKTVTQLSLCCAVGAGLFPLTASAQTTASYQATEITRPANAPANIPISLNENGDALVWAHIFEGNYNSFRINLFKNGTLTDPGFVPYDPYHSNFYMNQSGQVAGMTVEPTQSQRQAAFFDGQTLSILNPPYSNYASSYATGVNDAGDVVGVLNNWNNTVREVFLYRRIEINGDPQFNSDMQYLGTMGGNSAAPTDINNNGDISGDVWMPNPWGVNRWGFLRRSNGAVTILDSSTFSAWETWTTKINNAGQVIGGFVSPTSGNWRAFRYNGSAMEDLGTLGGATATATDINENGDVVGYSAVPGTNSSISRAFLKPANGAMIDLGALGGSSSQANDVNDNGEVVGKYYSPNGTRAFLWRAGQMYDLNTLANIGTDWRISDAVTINNQGQILVEAVSVTSGTPRAFILSRDSSINRTPIAQPDGQNGEYVMDEDSGSITMRVLDNDTDPDGDSLSIGVGYYGPLLWQPQNGTVSLSADGQSLIYTPNPNFSGWDGFGYYATDGTVSINNVWGTQAWTWAGVWVTPKPDAPVAVADNFNVDEDSVSNQLDVLANDYDADSDPLTIAFVDGTGPGFSISADRKFILYTPQANFNGSTQFWYGVTDGTTTTSVRSTVTVTPVNDAPTVQGDNFTVAEDSVDALLDPLANDSDVDGDALTLRFGNLSTTSIVTPNGIVKLAQNNTRFQYTPNANFNGSDSFTFGVSDGKTTTLAIAYITVTAVNDAPVANSQAVETDEDTAKNITLSATDIDSATLEYSIVGAPTHGTLSGTAPNLVYTPNANFEGADSFTFKANDGGADSNIATVSIEIKPVNDAPVASDISVETEEDSPKNIAFSATDVDGDALEYSVVSGPSSGTLSGSGATRTYTPNANFSGSDSFSFKANDGQADSNVATVTIRVNAANDAPVAQSQSVETDEDSAKTITLNATDIDGDSLEYSVVGAPSHGTLSGTAPNITYTPAANYNGLDSFSFQASDGSSVSNTATVSIDVKPVNDAPVAAAQNLTTTEDSSLGITLGASDIDGDSLNFRLISAPSNGTISGTAPNLVYTPNANFNGADSFSFQASDGQADSNVASIQIEVKAANDAPVASTQNVTLNEDVAKAITLSATDIDGDSLTYVIVTAPLKGVLSGSGANWTYTPNANANGADSFSFKANDGKTDSNTASVNLDVQPVNDAPVASGQSVTTAFNTAKSIALLATDIDGNALNYIVVSGPGKGTLSGTGASRTYTPNAGSSGSDSFTFKANDGQADSNTATVNITVQPNPNPARFEVRYVVRDQWNNGFVADVYIKNNGPAISGWTLAWNFPGNQRITNGWNANYKQTGKSVTAKDLGWNKSIPTGGTVTIGFQASYSSTNAKPTAFTLNGQTCAIVP